MKTVTWVVFAVGAVALFYVISGPFQAQVDQTIQQKTEWTPQNIQKNPGQYLFHSKNEAKDARDSLSASLIDLAQQRARLQSQFLSNQTELDNVGRLLPSLVSAYHESEDANLWPARIGETLLTERELKGRIMEADDRYQRAKENSQRLSQQLAQLSSREEQVREKIREVDLVITRIDAAAEELETRAALESIERIERDLGAIVSVAQVLEEISRDAGSLDALMEQQVVADDDERFRAILNRGP